jgi:hypothetical protein
MSQIRKRREGSPLGPDLTGKKWLWSDGSYAGITKTIADGVSQPKQISQPHAANGRGAAYARPGISGSSLCMEPEPPRVAEPKLSDVLTGSLRSWATENTLSLGNIHISQTFGERRSA